MPGQAPRLRHYLKTMPIEYCNTHHQLMAAFYATNKSQPGHINIRAMDGGAGHPANACSRGAHNLIPIHLRVATMMAASTAKDAAHYQRIVSSSASRTGRHTADRQRHAEADAAPGVSTHQVRRQHDMRRRRSGRRPEGDVLGQAHQQQEEDDRPTSNTAPVNRQVFRISKMKKAAGQPRTASHIAARSGL